MPTELTQPFADTLTASVTAMDTLTASATDTLTVDTAALRAFTADPDYNYARELVPKADTLGELISYYIHQFFDSIFNSDASNMASRPLLFTIGAVVVVSLAWLVIKANPTLFSRITGRKGGTFEVTEDTIYGIDFQLMLRQALARNDFREAARLTYLQTLRHLSDQKIISWQLYKTPSQYVAEYPSVEFRAMTNLFLRIRYADVEVSESDYDSMRRLKEAVEADIEKETAEKEAAEGDSAEKEATEGNSAEKETTESKKGGGRDEA